MEHSAIRYLVPVLPLPPLRVADKLASSPSLSIAYEDILLKLVDSDPAVLRELVCRWRSRLSSLSLGLLIDTVSLKFLYP